MTFHSQLNQNKVVQDTFHQGVRQAGFKGLLSYRTDIGIPGYTGYVPSSMSLSIPVKCSSHTGRLPDGLATQDSALPGANDPLAPPTEYRSCYKTDPSNYKPLTKTGGGYWFATRGTLGESRQFRGTSTYSCEVGHAEETARNQFKAVDGLACTLAAYEAARSRRSVSAGASLGSTFTKTTSAGALVGYKTTYQAMKVPIPLTPLPPAKSVSFEDDVDKSDQCAEPTGRTGAPKLDSRTMYKTNFGDLGEDPMMRAATSEKEMTRTATTAELAEGTTRNTEQVPGYGGFMAASRCNPRARAHSVGARPRPNHKTQMLLFDLDQFTRGRLPKYTGYKPQAPGNVSSEQPKCGFITTTTKGNTEHELSLQTATMSKMNGKIHSHKVTDGLIGFFQGGGEFISENGLSDAERYFSQLRPLEGRIKTMQASKTTEYGQRFRGVNAGVA